MQRYDLVKVLEHRKHIWGKRFRRWKFKSSIRPADIFVVSYPKSGTTWLGFLLENLLKENSKEEVHPPYQHAPNVNSEYQGDPPWQKWGPLQDPRFLRLHARYDVAFPNVIYLIRDPRDVMASYYHYERLRKPQFQSNLMEYVSNYPHWPCSWEQHVKEWLLDHAHPSLLLVRYEEMQKDTVGVLHSIMSFAGLSFSQKTLKQAVEASTFQKMQKKEREFQAVTSLVVRNGEQVIRKGKAEGWKEDLDRSVVSVIEKKYGEVMEKVGYPLSK